MIRPSASNTRSRPSYSLSKSAPPSLVRSLIKASMSTLYPFSTASNRAESCSLRTIPSASPLSVAALLIVKQGSKRSGSWRITVGSAVIGRAPFGSTTVLWMALTVDGCGVVDPDRTGHRQREFKARHLVSLPGEDTFPYVFLPACEANPPLSAGPAEALSVQSVARPDGLAPQP